MAVGHGRGSGTGLVLVHVGGLFLRGGDGELGIAGLGARGAVHSQRAEGGRGINVDNGDCVDVLGKQGHSHDRVGDGSRVFVFAFGMEADQIRLALGGVDKASTGEIAVAGVDIVEVDVFNRGGDDAAARDFGFGQQEERAVAHKILDVVKAELILHGDVRRAEVLVHIENVGEADSLRSGAVHLLELVFDAALGHRERHLIRSFAGSERAGVQVLVKASGHFGLQLKEELVVGHLHSVFVAVILDGFKGDGLCVLFDGDFRIGLFLHGEVAIRDRLAFADLPALQRAFGVLAFEDGAGLLADGTHDAEDFAQMLPIFGKAGNKVNFARGDGDISGFDEVGGCSHIILLSRKQRYFRR